MKTKYFIFKLGDEIFGTPLLSIREVVEYSEPKHVPNTKGWFKGVLNLRGEIVGVVDLRERLGINKNHSSCSLVFMTEKGPLAAIVDSGIGVREITDEDIVANPRIPVRVPSQFLIGVTPVDDDLVSLINVDQILGQDELVELTSVKLAI